MTASKLEFAAAIRMLTEMLKRQRHALAKRDFQKISSLAESTLKLLQQLEVAAEPRHGGYESDLESLRALSEENVARLASLRDSVIRARSRIENIANAEMSSGVYGEQGGILRYRAASRGRQA